MNIVNVILQFNVGFEKKTLVLIFKKIEKKLCYM